MERNSCITKFWLAETLLFSGNGKECVSIQHGSNQLIYAARWSQYWCDQQKNPCFHEPLISLMKFKSPNHWIRLKAQTVCHFLSCIFSPQQPHTQVFSSFRCGNTMLCGWLDSVYWLYKPLLSSIMSVFPDYISNRKTISIYLPPSFFPLPLSLTNQRKTR